MNRIWTGIAYIWGFTVAELIAGQEINLYLIIVTGGIILTLIVSNVNE